MPIAPFARYRPITGHDGGPAKGHVGLVLHVQQGDGSPHDYFQSSVAPNRKSSHFWISKTGVTEQFIDTDLEAWAQGDGNATWASAETEGQPTEALTDAQVAALAQLYRWGREVHGWPYQLSEVPQGSGFGTHSMGGAAWGGHACPGPIRAAQRGRILRLAEGGSDHTVIGPPQTFGDAMNRIPVHIAPLDQQGNGYVTTGIPFEKVVSVLLLGPAPQRDSYNWPNVYQAINDTSGQCEIEVEGGTPGGSVDVVIWSVS